MRDCSKATRKGASSVEFAFVAPVIFLLFFGFWEWSRVEMIRQACATASFEAARHGTLPSSTPASMKTVADQVLSTYSVGASTVSTTINSGTNKSLASIAVPLDQNTWGISLFFKGKTYQTNFELELETMPDLVGSSDGPSGPPMI